MDVHLVDAPLNVLPGVRLGPLKLGMSLFEALALLRTALTVTQSTERTSIVFSREFPVDRPIIVDVKSIGVRLRFDSKYQKLLVIDVYDVSILSLCFQDVVVTGARQSSPDAGTLKSMYEVLGVTHSGFRRDELPNDAFCLQYPGLLVSYKVPRAESFTGLPLILGDGQSPPLMRVVIHEIDFVRNVTKPIVRTSRLVDVLVTDDGPVELHIKDRQEVLVIGASACQDVLSCLGQATAVHVKRSEPIGTRARKENVNISLGNDREDYFLHYRDWGLDLLIDGDSHMLLKVIMRTNLPCHPTFGQYEKCQFTLRFAERLNNGKRGVVGGGILPSMPGVNGTGLGTSGKNGRSKAPAPSFEDILTSAVAPRTPITDRTTIVTCDESWPTLAKKLDVADEKPMVHEKSDQPFGPCLLFGYRHCVFEVDKASMHLASVTIF